MSLPGFGPACSACAGIPLFARRFNTIIVLPSETYADVRRAKLRTHEILSAAVKQTERNKMQRVENGSVTNVTRILKIPPLTLISEQAMDEMGEETGRRCGFTHFLARVRVLLLTLILCSTYGL